jgi:hypothetical protein
LGTRQASEELTRLVAAFDEQPCIAQRLGELCLDA